LGRKFNVFVWPGNNFPAPGASVTLQAPKNRSIAMFDDEVKKPKGHEVGMPIDTMSVEELTDRIGMLEAEIARLKAAIAARQKSKSDAASVFKF
jgi:uncharacterized small protein (DUF1192 family)